MSQVFMCDSCGNLFSVNQRGWKEFTERGDGAEYNNAWNHGAMTRHIGPCCGFQGQTVTPRIALPPSDEKEA